VFAARELRYTQLHALVEPAGLVWVVGNDGLPGVPLHVQLPKSHGMKHGLASCYQRHRRVVEEEGCSLKFQWDS
jgi:hypothetical protein